MYLISIHLPNGESAALDFDAFHAQYLPELGKVFRPYGLGWATVMRGEQALDGGPPAFLATIVLSFPTEQAARDAAASEEAQAVLASVTGLTGATPLVQFNTSVQ